MDETAASIRNDLDAAARKLAIASAQRIALGRRRDELTRDVGLAKGRLNRKPEVDKFLEELQTEAHRKRVGDFERLLTALVAEVLPGEPQVGLDLEIERGQPSLDIVSRRGGDLTEDIYDDQGGALTNVVSMGLRMIAAVRSGTRRFLIMDEGDCWIATSRVPTFYRVLKDAATKVGVQCLAISHHDVSAFGDGISVARLSGDKDTGALIENAPRRHKWTDDEDGIRYVRLKNFQTFVDETIHLSPGVNALEGRNNLGKSAIVRAFRAVFYGESRDALIRHGEKLCTIEIGFPGGRVLHWNRQARRNPINVWKLLGPDGAVVQEEGMVYETGGRTPPDWVSDLFGIRQVEKLDVHINTQKNPVFLLDKPGSTRASVLSIGQESSHIRSMITLHKERCVEDAASVKNGEIEMARIVESLDRLKNLDALNESLETARSLAATIEASRESLKLASDAATKLSTAADAVTKVRAAAERLGRLPDRQNLETIVRNVGNTTKLEAAAGAIQAAETKVLACAQIDHVLSPHMNKLAALGTIDELANGYRETVKLSAAVDTIVVAGSKTEACGRIADAMSALPAAIPAIARSDEKIMAGRAIRDAIKIVGVLDRKARLLSGVPVAFPEFASSAERERIISSLAASQAGVEAIVSVGAKIDADVEACREEIAQLVEVMDHSCPFCGSHIDAEVLISGHSHEGHQHG
jgi:hypothetical protein